MCGVAAALEGVCAGRNVRPFFDTLRFPPYSAPLWVWSIIGAVYYAIFGFVVFRLLSGVLPVALAGATLTLIVVMMLGNALANLVIFRSRDLHLSYVIGNVFCGPGCPFGLLRCPPRRRRRRDACAISRLPSVCSVVGMGIDETQPLTTMNEQPELRGWA